MAAHRSQFASLCEWIDGSDRISIEIMPFRERRASPGAGQKFRCKDDQRTTGFIVLQRPAADGRWNMGAASLSGSRLPKTNPAPVRDARFGAANALRTGGPQESRLDDHGDDKRRRELRRRAIDHADCAGLSILFRISSQTDLTSAVITDACSMRSKISFASSRYFCEVSWT